MEEDFPTMNTVSKTQSSFSEEEESNSLGVFPSLDIFEEGDVMETGSAFYHLLASPAALSVFLKCSQIDITVLSQSIFDLSEHLSMTQDALLALAADEISRRESEMHLFRIDSVATKFFGLWNRTVGDEYLKRILGTFQKYFNGKGMKVDEDIRSEEAQRKLRDHLHVLMKLLVGTTHLIPEEIRDVCHIISKKVSHKFGKRGARTFLVGYFFVRFFCPALAIPTTVGLEFGSQDKVCLMLSKFIQAAANQHKYDKNSQTFFANEFLDEISDLMELFLQVLRQRKLCKHSLQILDDCRREVEKMAKSSSNTRIGFLRKKRGECWNESAEKEFLIFEKLMKEQSPDMIQQVKALHLPEIEETFSIRAISVFQQAMTRESGNLGTANDSRPLKLSQSGGMSVRKSSSIKFLRFSRRSPTEGHLKEGHLKEKSSKSEEGSTKAPSESADDVLGRNRSLSLEEQPKLKIKRVPVPGKEAKFSGPTEEPILTEEQFFGPSSFDVSTNRYPLLRELPSSDAFFSQPKFETLKKNSSANATNTRNSPSRCGSSYKSLFNVISNQIALQALLEVMEEQENPEDLTSQFYFACSTVWLIIPAARALGMLEVERRDSANALFRSESIATQFFRRLNRSCGASYLRDLIGSFFFSQEEIFANLNLQMIHSPDEVPRLIARTKIERGYLLLVRLILGSIHKIPKEIKAVCSQLLDLVINKFGEESCSTFLAGYFFARFFCPALAMPESIDLKMSSESKRLSLLFSSLLQRGVCHQTFETENMRYANEFLPLAFEHIEIFFLALVEKELTESQRSIQLECRQTFDSLRKLPDKREQPDFEGESPGMFSEFLLSHVYVIREKVMQYELNPEEMEEALDVISNLRSTFRKMYDRRSYDVPLPGSTLSRKQSWKRVGSKFSKKDIKAPEFLGTEENIFEKREGVDRLQQILHQENSILMITIFQALCSLSASFPEYNAHMSTFLFLHGDHLELFKFFLHQELCTVKNVAVAMREKSESVCVLRHCLDLYQEDGMSIVRPLLKFASKLNKKKVALISEHPSADLEPKHKDFGAKFQGAVHRLLTPQNLPPSLCVFCCVCIDTVRGTSGIKRQEGLPLSHWAVGAIFFLRFLIPIITSYSLTVEGEKRKHMTLVGKILMKLCCKTPFQEGDCVINEVLQASYGLYDEFCERVVEEGREAGENVWKEVEKARTETLFFSRSWEKELAVFCDKHKLAILDNLAKEDVAVSVKAHDLLGQMRGLLKKK